jgi:antitoxin ParD1/3/4
MANFAKFGYCKKARIAIMNVSLTPELEQFVEARVRSGLYHSASEVIREGLRLLAEQDAVKQKRLDLLNIEIDKGLADLKSGNTVSAQSLKEDLLARRKTYGS